MTRHPIRWSSLIFGLVFLSGLGQWAVRDQDLMSARDLSLTTSAVLVVLGLLGVIATLWKPTRPADTTPEPADTTPDLVLTPEDHSPKGPEDEEADPQP
ncbi:MAG: hypothetical protein QOJ72_1131 [Nocardioidaceae bacterium]|jgi:hypothetical protein|nr:hypothetical protein [Nocardioidaceae bacterium]